VRSVCVSLSAFFIVGVGIKFCGVIGGNLSETVLLSQVAAKPWRPAAAGGAPVAQPVKVRSSSLTRSAAPQSNGGNAVTPDSPRSDIVVKSRRPSGQPQESSKRQVIDLSVPLHSVLLGVWPCCRLPCRI